MALCEPTIPCHHSSIPRGTLHFPQIPRFQALFLDVLAYYLTALALAHSFVMLDTSGFAIDLTMVGLLILSAMATWVGRATGAG